VLVLTLRNLLEFVLLGWAVVAVVVAPGQPGVDGHDDTDWLPSVWPFHDRPEQVDRS